MNQTSIILIVDDDSAGRETLAALLHGQGYTLLSASSGAEALRQARATVPDLILLDVMMPDMDGFDVCRQLRADVALAEVPIILVTALDDRDSRLAGIDAGADDFVSKPFDRTELRARIRAITRLNRYRRLLSERSRFERVIKLSPNGLMLVDAEGIIRLANPAASLMLGASENELVGHSARRFFPGPELERFLRETTAAASDATYVARFESVVLRADTGTLAVEIDAGSIEWEGSQAVQISLRDISERKRAEQAVQRQMERLTALRAIDSVIAASLNLNVMLNVVLDRLVEQIQVDAAAILLRAAHTSHFEYAVVRGLARADMRQGAVQLGEGFAGRVAQDRRTLSLAELTAFGLKPTPQPLAAYYGVPLIVKGQVEGVLEVFHQTPIAADGEWLEFLETLAGQAAVAIDHAAMFDSIQRANAELSLAYTTTLEGWARALELRDKETEGHAQRVTDMTLVLARAMGVSDAELIHVRRGALLHDIGKMGVPDSILLKPGPLTDEEWMIMRQHPALAYNLLKPIDFLRPALDIPYNHHEKWDGSGYPRGLSGEDIPLFARIFAVVDVWDALRFDRPYRSGWAEDRVRDYIRSQAGTHFDPQVVDVFLGLQSGVPNEQRITVLVVDADTDLAATIRDQLESQFFVLVAASSQQALDILQREQIAVLLADISMPVISGVQLMERAKYTSPATLGVLSSIHFDSIALSEALNLGNVRGFIHKPWNVSELRRRINEVAQQYRPPV